MPQFEKHFTIEEARTLIPELRARFQQIHVLLERIRTTQEKEGRRLNIARGNGKGPIVGGSGSDIEEVQEIIGSIALLGVQIKDLQRGLIDFPHFLNGNPDAEVFLCFELSDETVEYWHGIDAGYAGRTRL